MPLLFIHTNYKISYKEDLINLTKERENSKLLNDGTNLDAHPDTSAHSIAIGYGYDLFQNTASLKNDLLSLVTSKVANTTVSSALDSVVSLIEENREAVYKTLADGTKKFDHWKFKASDVYPTEADLAKKINSYITLSTEANAETLMLEKLDSVEAQVKAKTGLTESQELIALVDMAYNGGIGIIGSNLTAAVKNGDRVAAWYEIRYASNVSRNYGLQNRREAESDMFGLYSSGDKTTPINDNEAKQVIRFLEAKRSTIIKYLKLHPSA